MDYEKEVPEELRKPIKALADDRRLNIFIALLKEGEKSFSQLVEIAEVNRSTLNYHLKELMKSALIKNYFKKEFGSKDYSYYDVTKFGEEFLKNIYQVLERPVLPFVSNEVFATEKVSLKKEMLVLTR